MGGGHGGDVQGGHAGLAVSGDALAHVGLRADQRGQLRQLRGHQGLSLVLATGQVRVLDCLGLGLVTDAAGQVVVEVAAPGPHPTDVQS